MIKRLSWFAAGTGFGLGASVWVRKKVRSKVQEITPLAVSKAAIDSVSEIKERVVVALDEARNEIAQREIELRKEMGLRPKRKVRAH